MTVVDIPAVILKTSLIDHLGLTILTFRGQESCVLNLRMIACAAHLLWSSQSCHTRSFQRRGICDFAMELGNEVTAFSPTRMVLTRFVSSSILYVFTGYKPGQTRVYIRHPQSPLLPKKKVTMLEVS